MPNQILHKRSSTPDAVPTAAQLATGELALNTADGTWFLKKTDDSVIDIRKPTLLDGGDVVFDARAISGLAVWLDATVASSVTLVSDYVSQWSDLSGAGHHLTQSVEAARPALGTISGKTAIDFDGSNDYLSNAAAPSGWEFGTIVCVHERDGGGNQNVYGITTASNNTMYCSVANVAAEYRSGGGLGGTGGSRSTGVVTNGTPRLLTQTADNASVYDLRLDAATATGTTGGFLQTAEGTYLGGRNSANLGLGLFFNGKVGEFIVYNRVLTLAEIQKVEQYLAAKWGVTLA
jgi:hypothetical protein